MSYLSTEKRRPRPKKVLTTTGKQKHKTNKQKTKTQKQTNKLTAKLVFIIVRLLYLERYKTQTTFLLLENWYTGHDLLLLTIKYVQLFAQQQSEAHGS